MSTEDQFGTPNILGSLRNLSEYLSGDLTRPISITFAFVTCVSDTCILSELYFQDLCVVFSWLNPLDDSLLFETYIRPQL